jgi:hypothetical protein
VAGQEIFTFLEGAPGKASADRDAAGEEVELPGARLKSPGRVDLLERGQGAVEGIQQPGVLEPGLEESNGSAKKDLPRAA